MNILCPLCKTSNAEKVMDLPREFIVKALESFYDEPIPEVEIINYSLYICKDCSLEFITPEISGTEKFYTWITHQPNYYPSYRWEWGIVKETILQGDINASILDVGCGNGDFLKHMHKSGIRNLTGIDTSEPAIKVANIRGFNALCGNIYDERFVSEYINTSGYDFVVSFHCLEHVENPLKFSQRMLDFVKNGGKLFISTPYSPMSFESMWYDPLNHPPHHLSRWNYKAYTKLAQLLNVNMNVHFPVASKPLTRVFEALNRHISGYRNFYSRKNLYTYILKNPTIFLREFKKQKDRTVIEGRTIGDVILVEFTRK